jgi:signal transduction histidine kinase
VAAAPQDHDQALLEAGGAAACIIRNKQRIFDIFQQRVRAQVRAARPESTPMLIDTLPAFLTRIALALTPGTGLAFASEYTNIASQHGSERARFTHYSLSDVIQEYRLLREILVETLREDNGPDEHEWRVVHRSFDEAIAEAASSFVKTHENFRDLFTAALSHDFRGPLANASNYLELMRRGADPSRNEHFATRALLNLQQINRMIGELLDISRANAGDGLALQVQPCDAVKLARDVIEDLRVLHGDRFELHAPEAVPGHWDCERIKQSLHNLLENAFKYGREGSPISVVVASESGRLRLSCHNEGDPIPPEIIPELFKPFRRAPGAVAGNKPGWGLGLMLVQAIAVAHGGGVNVESTASAGTIFTFDVLCDARMSPTTLLGGTQLRA